MNSRTRGPDWSWCWSSRRTSCSGWPRTACCACWVESAGWPSQGAPQECCPPRERSELQARSQLPHLDFALLSKDLKTTSLVRPKPVLGVNFHLGERYVPGQKSIERQVFLHLTIFANGRLIFGKSSRDDLVRKMLRWNFPPGWQVLPQKKTKANHLLDQSVVSLAATDQESGLKQLAKPLRSNSVFIRRIRKKRREFSSVYPIRDSWL